MYSKVKKTILKDSKSFIFEQSDQYDQQPKGTSWSVDPDWDSIEDVDIKNFLR